MPTEEGGARLTQVLQAVQLGDRQASDELLPLVYDELHNLARSWLAKAKPGQTLQATALVHEAWMRLAANQDPSWDSRAHFFGAAAHAMRNILVEQARRRATLKRGLFERSEQDPDEFAIEPPVDNILAVHEALERLEEDHPKMARIVTLRFFGGLSMKEVARMVGDPLRSVERLWAYARVWLEHEVRGALDP